MKRYRKYLACIPAIGLALTIFWFSAQPADISTDMSDGVSRMLLKLGSWLNLIQGPQEEYYEMIEKMSMPIRKAAHVSEFAVFYFSLLFACYHWDLRGGKLLWTALALTFFYACTDEFHQLFVPGRAGQIRDVLIDSSGAFVITMAGLYRLRRRAGL